MRPKQRDNIRQRRETKQSDGHNYHAGTSCNKILKLSGREGRRRKVNRGHQRTLPGGFVRPPSSERNPAGFNIKSRSTKGQNRCTVKAAVRETGCASGKRAWLISQWGNMQRRIEVQFEQSRGELVGGLGG